MIFTFLNGWKKKNKQYFVTCDNFMDSKASANTLSLLGRRPAPCLLQLHEEELKGLKLHRLAFPSWSAARTGSSGSPLQAGLPSNPGPAVELNSQLQTASTNTLARKPSKSPACEAQHDCHYHPQRDSLCPPPPPRAPTQTNHSCGNKR